MLRYATERDKVNQILNLTSLTVEQFEPLLARLAHKNEPIPTRLLGRKQFPMAFGDNFDVAVDHFDGGLIVDRVRRTRDAGPPIFLASAIVFPGRSGWSRCGKIEKSTIPSVSSPPVGGVQPTKYSPMRGVITMLPALSPTQTVSRSDGKRSASPDCRIQ